MKNHDLLSRIDEFKNLDLAHNGIFNWIWRSTNGYPPIIAQLEELGKAWKESLPNDDLILEQEYTLGQILFSDEAQELQDKDQNVFIFIIIRRQELWGDHADNVYSAYTQLRTKGLFTSDCVKVVGRSNHCADRAQTLVEIATYFDIDKAFIDSLPEGFFHHQANDFIFAVESLSREGVIWEDDLTRNQIGQTLLLRGRQQNETYNNCSNALIRLYQKHIPFTPMMLCAFAAEPKVWDFVKACEMLHEKSLLNDGVLSSLKGRSMCSNIIDFTEAHIMLHENNITPTDEMVSLMQRDFPKAVARLMISPGNALEKLGVFATPSPVTTTQNNVPAARLKPIFPFS